MQWIWSFVQWALLGLVVVEWVATRRFQSWAFRITGLQVFHETRSSPGLPRSDEFETKNGRFKLVSPRVYLFYYYPVPLFFKGTIEWNEGQVTMHARISLALTLMLAFVVLGGFTLLFMAPPSTHVSVGMTATFLVMWTLMSVVFLLLVWRIIIRRAPRMILSELEVGTSRGAPA